MRRPKGIKIDSVSKQYLTPTGPITAVDDVTFEVEPGASITITGPSGCGKSTLLSLMAGLETPSMGRVCVGGEEVSGLSESQRAALRRRDFGLIFQRDNLLPFLTAIENISLQLAITGEDNGLERCVEILAQLGLASKADQLPDQLSGGERQRITIARAVIKEPSVILADEPTGSLDEQSSGSAIQLMIDIQSRAHTTLVVVTHDPEIALRMDRTLNLRDGRLCELPSWSGATPRSADV